MQREVDREESQWSQETAFEEQCIASQDGETIRTIRRGLPIVHVYYLVYMKPYKKGGATNVGDKLGSVNGLAGTGTL
jgi:hypothetical protein